MVTNLKIEIEKGKEVAIINLKGLLDAHNSTLFSDALKEVVNEGFLKIIVNFKNLEYLGSSGLEILLGKIQAIRNKGGDIVLCEMSSKIYKVFDLLGLTNYFKIFKSEEEALKSFENG